MLEYYNPIDDDYEDDDYEDDEYEDDEDEDDDDSESDDMYREVEVWFTREEAENYVREEMGIEEGTDYFDIVVNYERGDSSETIDICSWEDIPKGYEPMDENDREEYYDYLESKEELESLNWDNNSDNEDSEWDDDDFD